MKKDLFFCSMLWNIGTTVRSTNSPVIQAPSCPVPCKKEELDEEEYPY